MQERKLPKEDPRMRAERLRWSRRLGGTVCQDKTKFKRHLKHKKGTDEGPLSFCLEVVRWAMGAVALVWIACYSAGQLDEAVPIWKTDYLQLQRTE